jgi:hypothetical protein
MHNTQMQLADGQEYISQDDWQQQQEEARLMQLAGFAQKLVSKRKEAIDGRKASGIETLWREDEEHYDGIDDANRATETWLKPTTMQGRPTMSGIDRGSSRSNAFVNITQPYTDMGASRAAEMLLPTDDPAFKFNPSPIPDIANAANSTELMPDGKMTVAQAVKAMLQEAQEKADAAGTQVWDWLVESRWHSEMRKCIEQAAKIGTGVMKGPFPIKRLNRAVIPQPDGSFEFHIEHKLVPGSKQIDAWNFYPDPACLDDIHNGSYCFERDYISAKQLKDLIGVPGYLEREILAVLKEGPGKKHEDGRGQVKDTENFEIWYYHGTATPSDYESTGKTLDEDSQSAEQLHVVVVMVNDRIIKASRNVLDSGAFPYDVMVWQRRADYWAGIGIARQVRTPQRMVNAATRNLLDNAGVAAGPQIIIKDGVVVPADGNWEITPRKVWRVDEDADINDVSHAMTSIVIPMLEAELQNIVQMALDFAERATSMPLILAGHQGSSTETVGGMQILQSNASSVLRRIARIADDDVIEPHVLRYYEWLMLYGDDPNTKGDFQIAPQGSAAFFERDAQNQLIMQLLPMAQDPEFELDKAKLMEEVLKMNKLSPARVRLSDEQKEQRAQQEQPVDPALQIAQLKAQTDMQREQLKQQSDLAELKQREEMARADYAFKLHLSEMEQEFALRIKEMELQVKMIELSQAQQISLDSIKAQLAGTTLKLRTQEKLSFADKQYERSKEAITPPTEPAGRADPGDSFHE